MGGARGLASGVTGRCRYRTTHKRSLRGQRSGGRSLAGPRGGIASLLRGRRGSRAGEGGGSCSGGARVSLRRDGARRRRAGGGRAVHGRGGANQRGPEQAAIADAGAPGGIWGERRALGRRYSRGGDGGHRQARPRDRGPIGFGAAGERGGAHGGGRQERGAAAARVPWPAGREAGWRSNACQAAGKSGAGATWRGRARPGSDACRADADSGRRVS